jgi:hypothetical protein
LDTRTFAMQVETLKDYRSKGEQRMTVVHVAEGGQAIVSNANATPEGRGRARNSRRNHMHWPMHQALVSCDIEAEREAMPIAGRERV